MDAETITFITGENRELRKELKKDLKEIIEPVIDEVKIIKNETRTARWLHRNQRIGYALIVLAIMLISLGVARLNLKPTVEKILRIELNE